MQTEAQRFPLSTTELYFTVREDKHSKTFPRELLEFAFVEVLKRQMGIRPGESFLVGEDLQRCLSTSSSLRCSERKGEKLKNLEKIPICLLISIQKEKNQRHKPKLNSPREIQIKDFYAKFLD